ncbi:unnamed protein product, partial [Symbiodinium necroappetens]
MGMTLESLMKQEKLDYADAVCVYLAYQDSLKSSGRTKKPAAPDTEKLEDTQSAGNSVPSETGKKKSPKNAPTETEDVQSACNSISSGTGKKKSPKNAPMETETEEAPKKSRNQVSAKSRPSKASLKRGVASSNLGLDQDPEGAVVRPTKRLKGKTPPETIPNPQDDTLCDDEEDAECWDDELSYEYELWRHGLPQLSELESDLKAHRAAPTVPVPGVLVPAESEDQCGSNDSQVSGSTFVDAQVASALDMHALLERVKQLELEKAELQTQISTGSTTPVATPTRNKEHVFHEAPDPATSPGGGLPASVYANIRTQADPVPMPAGVPPSGPAVQNEQHGKINSANYRKEYMKLNRLYDSGELASYPNMQKLQEGTLDEKRKLLREWVISGQNLQACESAIEDTLYWCIVARTQVESSDYRIKQNLKANCRPGSSFFDGPLPGADPGLLHKRAAAGSQQAPLKADVLREFDQRKAELSAIAAQGSGSVAGSTATTVKGSLINEIFACKEIKKNLGSINDMLFDMGEPTGEDSVRYQKDLKAHEKKIKNLAKKFHSLDPTTDVEQMDKLCEDVHDVQKLGLTKAQAKGLMKELSKMASSSGHTVGLSSIYRLCQGPKYLESSIFSFGSTLTRTPDLSKCRTGSKASRYIMYSLPVKSYMMHEKTNVSLQALNKAIVDDLKLLSTRGVSLGSEVYYFHVVGFRGDLKQMAQ